jgi:hypothetical protein
MRNRTFTLLAVLAANDRWNQPDVLRTVLMKQVFLADTLRSLYRIWLQTFSFVRYHYGPWSADVFKRLDTLICNGLAEVVEYKRRADRVEARYRITPAGHRILQHFSNSELINLASDLVWALQTIGVEQATSICKLAYEEAEFARIFAQHQQAGIGPEAQVPLPAVTTANNETFATLAVLQGLARLSTQNDATLSTREIVRIFLKSLAAQIPASSSVDGVAA